jgi:hypothetical protein
VNLHDKHGKISAFHYKNQKKSMLNFGNSEQFGIFALSMNGNISATNGKQKMTRV